MTKIMFGPHFKPSKSSLPYKVHYLGSLTDGHEYLALDLYFDNTAFMTKINKPSAVIPRYTVQPYDFEHYYKELSLNGHVPVNSLQQYRMVSDIRNWYHELEPFTPKTWFSNEFQYVKYGGPFIVRGIEKSRKDNWAEKMYAPKMTTAVKIVAELYQDSGYGFSDCVVRKHVPLKRYGVGINEMPITQEYRVFIYKGKVQYSKIYWTNYLEVFTPEMYDPPQEMFDYLERVLYITEFDKKVNWFSIDIAKTEDHVSEPWVVIEVNDAQRSGVPVINPEKDYDTFYHNLRTLADVDPWVY